MRVRAYYVPYIEPLLTPSPLNARFPETELQTMIKPARSSLRSTLRTIPKVASFLTVHY